MTDVTRTVCLLKHLRICGLGEHETESRSYFNNQATDGVPSNEELS